MKPELKSTQNYNLFTYDSSNRPIGDVSKLVSSMKQFGFLPSHPLHVIKRGQKLVIVDGQHRYTAAKSLSIPVFYVVCENADLSIPAINNAQSRWTLDDYVASFANQGNIEYVKLLEFAKRNEMHIRATASMMNGECADSGNVCEKIRSGTFRIKTTAVAHMVAEIAAETAKHVPWSRHQGYIGALSRCMMVKEFSPSTYIRNITRYPSLLVPQPSREGFLQMIEEAVNYRMSKKIPLAFLARKAAAQRNAIKSK